MNSIRGPKVKDECGCISTDTASQIVWAQIISLNQTDSYKVTMNAMKVAYLLVTIKAGDQRQERYS